MNNLMPSEGFPVAPPIVLFIFSQVETASYRLRAIKHSHALISTYHAREFTSQIASNK